VLGGIRRFVIRNRETQRGRVSVHCAFLVGPRDEWGRGREGGGRGRYGKATDIFEQAIISRDQ